MTHSEYVAIISEVTGKTLKYNQVPLEVFAKFPIPIASEVAVMFEIYEVGNLVRDIQLTRTLNPKALAFREWAEKNKDKFKFP